MALIRWNPMNLSSLLNDDWDIPTLPGFSGLGQGLNIYETDNQVVAEASLPGIKDSEVDVTYEDGVVRITGATQDSQEDKAQRRYFMTSRATSFNYSFRLPEGLTANEPECDLEDGVLTLRFNKVEKAPPKKIVVKNKKAVK